MLNTKYFLAFIIILTSSKLLFGQSLKIITPTIGVGINYTKEEQLLWQSIIDKYAKINSGDLNYDSLSILEKTMIDSLEIGGGPLTEVAGCSWYCGGQMYKVMSNSYLTEHNQISYKPENIHDFDLLTAWVPDSRNGVIGRKINFHFKPLSPRVNEIIIYNGYVKNYSLFKSNSRVKKFKLYVNGFPYANLLLADTTAQQSFKIDPMRSENKKTDLILTFEILEIYKGSKYRDVAVSEINFSGLDVH